MARKSTPSTAVTERMPVGLRIPLILVAFTCGVVAAIAVGTSVGVGIWKDAAWTGKAGYEGQLALFQKGMNPAFAISVLLAAAAVAAAEFYRIRFTLYYLVTGGLAVVAAAYAMGSAAGIEAPMTLWRVYATAGILGGAIYWLIAGRAA